jgi:hypothetical protein
MQDRFLAVNDICSMTVFVFVLHLLILTALSVFWWKKIQRLRVFYWPALIVKLASGILVGVLYTYYYSVGDTFGFFQDAMLLTKLARTDFPAYINFLWNGDESFVIWSDLVLVQPRSLFFVKFISFFSLITFDNYWLISLYFSFISFAAMWLLVTTIAKQFPESTLAAVIAFLFFPSIVFWGSGIIKECTALACLAFLSFVFIRRWKNQRVSIVQWLLAVWGLWILWNLKYYYAAVFIPVVITAYLIHAFVGPKLKLQHLRSEFFFWVMIFVVLLFAVSLLHPNFYPQRFLEVVAMNYETFETISAPHDMIHFHDLKATPESMLINAPWALLSGLFRPFLWESGNVLQLFLAIENTLLIILLVTSLRALTTAHRSQDRLLILSLIIYIVLLCVFVTLSTPNFGTLARYRVGYLPFFAFLVMCNNPLIRRLEKFLQRFTGDLVRKHG